MSSIDGGAVARRRCCRLLLGIILATPCILLGLLAPLPAAWIGSLSGAGILWLATDSGQPVLNRLLTLSGALVALVPLVRCLPTA